MSSIIIDRRVISLVGRCDVRQDCTIGDMDTKILNTFGKRLRILRKDADLTQHELRDGLLKKCGVSLGQSYLSEIESSDKVPGGELVQALARFFNVTADYLLLLTDAPRSPDENPLNLPIESEGQRNAAEEAIEMLVELPPGERQHVIDAMRLLVDMPPGRKVDAVAVLRALWASDVQSARQGSSLPAFSIKEWERRVRWERALLSGMNREFGTARTGSLLDRVAAEDPEFRAFIGNGGTVGEEKDTKLG